MVPLKPLSFMLEWKEVDSPTLPSGADICGRGSVKERETDSALHWFSAKNPTSQIPSVSFLYPQYEMTDAGYL